MSNQSLKQASIRAVTGTTGTYEEDWGALFDLAAIAGGTFNERLLAYINYKLSSSYNNLPSAMQAFAADNGAYNWDSLGTFDASEGGGGGSLADVIASAVFDLDATISASYPGTGTTWANLVAAPADSSDQTDYDFTITGVGFNGSAGDPAAYFATTAADQYFRVAANTTFLGGLQRNTAVPAFWGAIAWKPADAAGNAGLFMNKDSGSNSVAGFALYRSSAEVLIMRQATGGASNAPTSFTPTVTPGTDYVLVFSVDYATDTLRFWLNTTTATEYAFALSDSVAAVSTLFTIFASSSGGFDAATGDTIYSFAMGNEYLDNTKAAAIIAALEARHGRDYTP
jgi:hypothetical protein